MAKTINTSNDFKKLVGKDEFEVTYRKANGQFRKATGKLGVTEDSEGNQLVKGTMDEDRKAEENETGTVRYFDVEKDAYRSFKLDKVRKLKISDGQEFDFGM